MKRYFISLLILTMNIASVEASIQAVSSINYVGPTDSLKGLEQGIQELIDRWHQAATDADIDAYFNLLAENSIFLGTDPAEDWTKDEFYAAVKEAFAEAPAWDFTASDRHLRWIVPGKVIHFYEKLDTWMGPCRGSGLVEKIKGEWKITFYNLSNTIPNKIVKDYVKFYKQKMKEKE